MTSSRKNGFELYKAHKAAQPVDCTTIIISLLLILNSISHISNNDDGTDRYKNIFVI